jgi:hypothetical protein
MNIVEGILLLIVGSIIVSLTLTILEFVQNGIVVAGLFTGDWIGSKLHLNKVPPNSKLVTTGIFSLVLVKLCLSIFGFAATVAFAFDQRIWLDDVRDWSAFLSWLFLIPLAVCAFIVGIKNGKENIFRRQD